MSRRKRVLLVSGKLAVAALLIGWLIRSGTLDFGALSLFFEEPALLTANLAVFAFTVTLGALRWRLLLRLAGVHLPVRRALQLTLTAMFFNVVLPGNIGGDVVRSVYVARAAAPGKWTSVFVIALLDRFLALAGLSVVAVVLTLARGLSAWEAPQRRELSGAVVALLLVMIVAPTLLLVMLRRSSERLEGWTRGATRLARILAQLVAAARLVWSGPGLLLAALGLAIATHLAGIVLFSTLASAIISQPISISAMAGVYPLGMLSMVLPISHAGLGVGHVAFERLFAMVGLRGGATVINVYLIGQTTPCLFGAIPYLMLRREAPPPTEAELAAQLAPAEAPPPAPPRSGRPT